MVLGWVGVSRIRGRGFHRLPKWGAFALLAAAPLALVASVVVPAVLWPTPSGPRPASTATIAFAEPAPEPQGRKPSKVSTCRFEIVWPAW